MDSPYNLYIYMYICMHAQIHPPPPPPPPPTHTHSHIDSGSRASPVGLTIPLCSTLRLVPSVLATSTRFSCESTQYRFWLSQSIASDVTAMGCSLRMRWGVRSEGEGGEGGREGGRKGGGEGGGKEKKVR